MTTTQGTIGFSSHSIIDCTLNFNASRTVMIASVLSYSKRGETHYLAKLPATDMVRPEFNDTNC